MTEKFSSFDVTVEPVFVPGEGRAIEYLKDISMRVYAKDIPVAMKKVQDLLRIDSNTYEFVSIVRTGSKHPTWGPF